MQPKHRQLKRPKVRISFDLQFVEEMIKAGTIVDKKSTIKVETGSTKNKVVALDTTTGIAVVPVD